jgi:hypothetical protein
MVIGVKDLGWQDKDANASTSASSISSDAEQAVIYWQSNNKVQLPPIHKKIAIEAYNTQYREKRGIVRQDLVDI